MNCHACGTALSSNALSCPNCGAPVYAAPASATQPAPTAAYAAPASPAQPAAPVYAAPAPAAQSAAPRHMPPVPMHQPAPAVYMAPAPAVSAIALAENPQRAVVLAASLFAAIVISTFYVAGWDENSLGYLDAIYLALLGCGAYLVAKPGVLPKAAAGAIALLAPIAYSSAFTIYLRFREVLLFEPFALIQTGGSMLLSNIVFAICFTAAAFGLSFAFGRRMNHRVGLTAVCLGGAFVLISFIIGAVTRFGNIPAVFMTQFLGEIPAGLLVGLAFMLASMLGSIKSTDLETRVGHKIWFGVCLGFTSLSFIVTFVGGYIGSMFFGYSGFVLALLTITGIVGYAQLLMAKRIGFFLVLIATGTMFFGVLIPNFTQLMGALAYGSGPMPMSMFLANIGTSFSTIVNPFITGIVLLFIWKKIPAAKPYVKPQVLTVFKAFAIAAVVVGAVLFLLGSAQFFNPYAVRAGTTPPTVSFMCGVLLGAGTTVVGIYATLAAFRKQSKAPKPLFITAIVLASLAFVSLAILMIP